VQVWDALNVLGAAGFAKDNPLGREEYLVFDRDLTSAALMHKETVHIIHWHSILKAKRKQKANI